LRRGRVDARLLARVPVAGTSERRRALTKSGPAARSSEPRRRAAHTPIVRRGAT
jgi:hypothetical protein